MPTETQKIRLLLELTGPDAKKLEKLADNKNPIKIKAQLQFDKSRGGDFALLKKLQDNGLNIKTTIQFTGPDAKILRELCAGKLSPTLKVKTDVSSSRSGGASRGGRRPTAQESQKQLNVDTVSKYNREYARKEKEIKDEKKREAERYGRLRSNFAPVNDSIYREELLAAQRRLASRGRPRLIIGNNTSPAHSNKFIQDLEKRNQQQLTYTDNLISKQNAKARQESYNAAVLAGKSQKYKQNFENAQLNKAKQEAQQAFKNNQYRVNFENAQRKASEQQAVRDFSSRQSALKLQELLEKKRQADFRGSYRRERAEETFKRSSIFEKEDEVLKRISYQEGLLPSQLSHLKGTRKTFSKDRLKGQGVGESLALSFLLGGPVEAGGGLIGGLATGSVAGVTLGAAGAAAAFGLLAGALEKVLTSAAEFQRSVTAISATFQSISTVTGAGGRTLPIGEQIQYQEKRARDIQLKARSKLLPLGISGSREAAIVSSVIGGLGSKGLSDDLTVKLSEGLGALAQTYTPDIGEAQLRKDIRDIVRGSPAAGRTTLGLAQPSIVSQFKNASSPADYENIARQLLIFSDAIRNSSQGIVQWTRGLGLLEGIFTVIGDDLIQTFQPALKLAADGLESLVKNLNSDKENRDKEREKGNFGPELFHDLSSGAVTGGTIGGLLGLFGGVPGALLGARTGALAGGSIAVLGSTLTGKYTTKPSEEKKLSIRPDTFITDTLEDVEKSAEVRNEITQSRLSAIPSFRRKERISTEIASNLEEIVKIQADVQEASAKLKDVDPAALETATKNVEKLKNTLKSYFSRIKELIVEGINTDLNNLDAKTTSGFVGDFLRLRTQVARRTTQLINENGQSPSQASIFARGEYSRGVIDQQIAAYQSLINFRSGLEAVSDASRSAAISLQEISIQKQEQEFRKAELNLDREGLPIEEREFGFRKRELKLRGREQKINKKELGFQVEDLPLKFEKLNIALGEVPFKFKELSQRSSDLTRDLASASMALQDFEESAQIRDADKELKKERAEKKLSELYNTPANTTEEILARDLEVAQAQKDIRDYYTSFEKESLQKESLTSNISTTQLAIDQLPFARRSLEVDTAQLGIDKKRLGLEPEKLSISKDRQTLDEDRLTNEFAQLSQDEKRFLLKKERLKKGGIEDQKVAVEGEKLKFQEETIGRALRDALENLNVLLVQMFQQFVGTKLGDALKGPATTALGRINQSNASAGVPATGDPQQLLGNIVAAAAAQQTYIPSIDTKVGEILNILRNGLDKETRKRLDEEKETKELKDARDKQKQAKPGDSDFYDLPPDSIFFGEKGKKIPPSYLKNPANPNNIKDIFDENSIPGKNKWKAGPGELNGFKSVSREGGPIADWLEYWRTGRVEDATTKISTPIGVDTDPYTQRDKDLIFKEPVNPNMLLYPGESPAAPSSNAGIGPKPNLKKETPLEDTRGQTPLLKGGGLDATVYEVPLPAKSPNAFDEKGNPTKDLLNTIKNNKNFTRKLKVNDYDFLNKLKEPLDNNFLRQYSFPAYDVPGFQILDNDVFTKEAPPLVPQRTMGGIMSRQGFQPPLQNIENAANMTASILGENAKKFKSVEASAGNVDLAQGLFNAVMGSDKTKGGSTNTQKDTTKVDDSSISKLGDAISKAFQQALSGHFQ